MAYELPYMYYNVVAHTGGSDGVVCMLKVSNADIINELIE